MIPGIVASQAQQQAQDDAPSSGDLDDLSQSPTFAFSMSRALLDAYVSALYSESGGLISQINDQSGNNRNLTQATSSSRPTLTTEGPNSREAAQFTGFDDQMPMTGVSLSSIFNSTSAYVVISGIIDAIDTNEATLKHNETIWADSNFDIGIFCKDAPLAIAAFDNGGDTYATAEHDPIPVGSPIVIEWRRDGTELASRVNGGIWVISATALTTNMPTSGSFGITRATPFPSTTNFLDFTLFECVGFADLLTSTEEDALVAQMMDHIGAT